MNEATLPKNYMELREACNSLLDKIIDKYQDTHMPEAYKHMGMTIDGDKFLMDPREYPMVSLFATLTCVYAGKTLVELYNEEVGPENDYEKEVLEALCDYTYPSLFKVSEVNHATDSLVLFDVFDSKGGIEVYDSHLCSRAKKGWLFFGQLSEFEDFTWLVNVLVLYKPSFEKGYMKAMDKQQKRFKNISDRDMRRMVANHRIWMVEAGPIDHPKIGGNVQFPIVFRGGDDGHDHEHNHEHEHDHECGDDCQH